MRSRFRRQRHLDEFVASGCRRIGFCGYVLCVFAYNRPNVRAKHHERQPSSSEILLASNVLIRRNQNIEAGIFGGLQKLRVFKLKGPSGLDKSTDLMFWQETTHSDGNVLIKQDAQRDDLVRNQESL